MAYPDAALPPNDHNLQQTIEHEVEKLGADKVSLKDIKESLEKRYGALVDETHAKNLAVVVFKQHSAGASQRPAKRLKKDVSCDQSSAYPTALVARVKCA